MFNFEKLTVYQTAIQLSKVIYSITGSWPKSEMFGLINQLRRAVVSIALNIAEGTSRSKKEFSHFLDMARGSCYEVIAILQIANGQSYLSEKQYLELYDQINKLTRSINSLKLAVNK